MSHKYTWGSHPEYRIYQEQDARAWWVLADWEGPLYRRATVQEAIACLPKVHRCD